MPRLPHAGLKIAIVALLAVDSVAYVLHGTASEALDAVAWYVLLVLFYWETAWFGRTPSGPLAFALRSIRLAADAAIVVAAVRYTREGATLNAFNAWCWIAVVIALEFEVRHPAVIARRRAAFVALTGLLYAGLVAAFGAWLARGEWFNGYDALLWLLAFAIIEIDLLAPRAAADAAVRAADQA